MQANKKELEKQLEELKNIGITVFSFSRLGVYNECPYAYKLGYIDKIEGLDNIYSALGGAVHDELEAIYNGKENELQSKFDNAYKECIEKKLFFPSSSIEEGYLSNINHYIKHFKKDDLKSLNEYMFIIEINGVHLVGYIDRVTKDPNGDGLRIIDYKTSTKYQKRTLAEHGRQLVLYAMAVEKISGLPVTCLCWNMLKYAEVKYLGKKKFKRKEGVIYERNKIVATFRAEMIGAFEEIGYTEDEAIDKYYDALVENDIPDEIKHLFEIKDGYQYYPYNEETKEDLVTYITETVEKIKNDNKWKHKKIDRQSDFMCLTLCNHRKVCPYIKKYINNETENPDDNLLEELEDLMS